MKAVVKNEAYGEIVYNENFFTGGKSITIDGAPATKLDRKTFKTEKHVDIIVTGNFLTGVKAKFGVETIVISPAAKWYEYVLSVLPFILIMVWGNSVELCSIVPIIGGAIGGAASALMSAVNLLIIRNVKAAYLKIIISIAMLVATFGICYILALAFVAAVLE